jgi:hypothetical protein
MSEWRTRQRISRTTRPAETPVRTRKAGSRLGAFSRQPLSFDRQTGPLSHDDDVFDLLRIEPCDV